MKLKTRLFQQKKEGYAGEVAISKRCKLYLPFCTFTFHFAELAHAQMHVTEKVGFCGRSLHLRRK